MFLWIREDRVRPEIWSVHFVQYKVYSGLSDAGVTSHEWRYGHDWMESLRHAVSLKGIRPGLYFARAMLHLRDNSTE